MSARGVNARREAEWVERPVPTALYRCYSAEGSLLYVGITNDVRHRMGGHARNKPWFRFGEVEDVEVEWFENRLLALDAEAIAIWQERPQYNIDRPLPETPKRAVRHGEPIALADALKRLEGR